MSIILVCCGYASLAQTVRKIPADKQRALQWKPEKGQYYFSHALVFDYNNKAEKSKGTIKVYLDPVTGAMCFKKETSFGSRGKQFDFIIGFPDGRYIYCGNDENGRKIRINEVVKELKPDAETRSQQKEDFTTYCIPTGNTRTDFGLQSLEYELTYATSGNKDKVWLTRTPFSNYPLYGMEFLEGAVSMPVTFDYMYLLPQDLLVTEISSKDLSLKLTGFGADPLTVSTKGYQELKLGD
ncbi:hypothetical protein HWI92_14170 [Dyadobacter sandarakinus]|uniref:GLPGLI family protein n=2 Tax=Dyadobacter sandarakinus TaxID=2747268 RepID=A0ABX7IF79_9BACT|nr:hypothetical protein HWI92_14170 [Dyadobacter sandarakinus]